MAEGLLVPLSSYLKHPNVATLTSMDLSAAPVAVRLEHEMQHRRATLAAAARQQPPPDLVSRFIEARDVNGWKHSEFPTYVKQQRPPPPPPPVMQAGVKPAFYAPPHAPLPVVIQTAPMPNVMTAPAAAAAAAAASLTGLPVETLAEHVMSNDDKARYVRQIKQNDRGISEEMISALPSFVEQLAWVNTIEDAQHKLWFHQLPQVVAATGFEFPRPEVLSREYIQQFLRAVDPAQGEWERPCCGITDPKTLTRIPCESVTLKGGGFVCRELLLPSVMKRVLRAQAVVAAARREKKPVPVESTPNFVLPHEKQMCFLCHLRVTNEAYFRARVFEDERVEDETTRLKRMRIINGFCVMVNKAGEYRIESTLPGYETHPCGVAGPFPAYQRNYIPHVFQGGIRGWLEPDRAVF